MSGYLVVVSSPHYAVTNANGGFYFRSLPPGRYRMKAWSDRSATPTVSTLTIKAGANDASVVLNSDAPQVQNTDKFGAPRGPSPSTTVTAR